ncbi:MAG: glycosyltransferase family 4 protein [Winogradskyella sp.]
MYKIFLETHNINNMFTGFGQYNFHLLKALMEINDSELEFHVHTRPLNALKPHFGTFFKYKRYFGARRYKFTSVRKKYDIWHSLNQNTKIEPYYNLPYVLTIHDVNFIEEISSDLNNERNQRFIEKLNRSHAIIYISEFAKSSTHKYFNVPNIPEYVIYNGNPLVSIENLDGFSTAIDVSKKYLYSIGDFLERKKFHLLVEMMQYLPNYNLVISGNDTRPYGNLVREMISKYNLSDRVFLTGRVTEKEKHYYLKNCTAFVLPSQNEGFGLPVIEAMKFGVPVFLSNSASLPEIGGKYAFYWDNLNAKYMADILNSKLDYYENNKILLAEKLKERASYFSWHKAAKLYIEVYKKLLKDSE